MANIQPEITAFKSAVYGEDVRDAMVSLANKLNAESSSSAETVSNFQQRLSNVEGKNVDQDTEINDLISENREQDSKLEYVETYTLLLDNGVFESSDSATSDLLDTMFPLWNTVEDGSPLKFVDDSGCTVIDFQDFPISSNGDYSLAPGIAIADQDGGIVFEASRGRQNTLCGKTISFIGDSISTFQGYIPSGYAYYYPRWDIQTVDQTWWKQLIDQTGLRLIQNCSWSGSRVSGNGASTESAAAACSTARINDVSGPNNETPDFVVILISVNDHTNNVPLGEWSYDKPVPEDGTMTTITDAYMLMLDKLHRAYPTTKVFCCTIVPRLMAAGNDVYPVARTSDGLTLHELNDRIRDIARAMNCEVIDFETCGISIYNQEQYMGDARLHPNASGADIMTQTARMALERYNTKVV